MHSTIAPASSSGVALGICPFPEVVSEKMGRTSKVQLGQMAGAREFLLAHKMPATNVPCMQAALLAWAHAPESFPGTSRIFSLTRLGWFLATGPSINPTIISARPLVRSINAASLTKSNGVMARSQNDKLGGEKSPAAV